MLTTKWNKTGHTSYKGLTAMQSDISFEVFNNFFEHNQFVNFVEIGTAFGGWARYLSDVSRKQRGRFITYDIRPTATQYENFRSEGIDFREVSCFDDKDRIYDLMMSPGRSILFCDGGDKISEVNMFAGALKNGDCIFAHDYSPTRQIFESEIKGKYWDWCEIFDEPIIDSLNKNNIVPITGFEFDKCAWYAGIKHG